MFLHCCDWQVITMQHCNIFQTSLPSIANTGDASYLKQKKQTVAIIFAEALGAKYVLKGYALNARHN